MISELDFLKKRCSECYWLETSNSVEEFGLRTLILTVDSIDDMNFALMFLFDDMNFALLLMLYLLRSEIDFARLQNRDSEHLHNAENVELFNDKS